MIDPNARGRGGDRDWLPRILVGAAGVLAFFAGIVLFVALVASGRVFGLGMGLTIVIALFEARRRSGPSNVLGAVAVGAAIALVVVGGCVILLSNSRLAGAVP